MYLLIYTFRVNVLKKKKEDKLFIIDKIAGPLNFQNQMYKNLCKTYVY